MSITRSAIILYSKIIRNNKIETHILTGDGANGITSLGGRSKKGENKYACAIRETKEETRGILDYSRIPEIFSSKNCRELIYSNCSYFMIQVSHVVIQEVCKNFEQSEKTTSEELKSLKVFEIEDLVWNILKNPEFRVNQTFRDMFLSVGFDWFKGNSCNEESRFLDSKNFEVFTSLNHFPNIISLHPINCNFVKKIHAKIDDKYLVSDQYYGFINGTHLFR